MSKKKKPKPTPEEQKPTPNDQRSVGMDITTEEGYINKLNQLFQLTVSIQLAIVPLLNSVRADSPDDKTKAKHSFDSRIMNLMKEVEKLLAS